MTPCRRCGRAVGGHHAARYCSPACRSDARRERKREYWTRRFRPAESRHTAAPEAAHPATHDRDYTADELELLKRVDAWKRRTGTKFPLVTDVMRLMLGMGYRRGTPGA